MTEQRQRETEQIPGAAWASLGILEGKPTKVELNIRVEAGEQILLLAAFDIINGPNPYLGGRRDFSFRIPVRWNHNTPHTRERGRDNVDLILLDRNTRKLTVLQSGLFTRGKKFYVFTQKTWEGWIEGVNRNLMFIPTSPHACPGNEFGKEFPDLAQIIKEQIPNLSRDGLVKEPVNIEEGTWEPNFPPAKVGWQRSSVLFFNVLTGVGLIMDRTSGEVFMVHFSTRVVEGNLSMGIPCPGQGVYYRPRLKKGDRVIKQVKAWIIA